MKELVPHLSLTKKMAGDDKFNINDIIANNLKKNTQTQLIDNLNLHKSNAKKMGSILNHVVGIFDW